MTTRGTLGTARYRRSGSTMRECGASGLAPTWGPRQRRGSCYEQHVALRLPSCAGSMNRQQVHVRVDSRYLRQHAPVTATQAAAAEHQPVPRTRSPSSQVPRWHRYRRESQARPVSCQAGNHPHGDSVCDSDTTTRGRLSVLGALDGDPGTQARPRSSRRRPQHALGSRCAKDSMTSPTWGRRWRSQTCSLRSSPGREASAPPWRSGTMPSARHHPEASGQLCGGWTIFPSSRIRVIARRATSGSGQSNRLLGLR